MELTEGLHVDVGHFGRGGKGSSRDAREMTFVTSFRHLMPLHAAMVQMVLGIKTKTYAGL